MNLESPNQLQPRTKTRRAKLHVRKTYKSVTRKQSSFLEIFNGLDGQYEDNENKYRGYPLTYCEVTEAGINKMSKIFAKYLPLQKVPVQNRTFYDLGCGLGKMVIGIALLNPQIRSIGIELVEERAHKAGIVVSRLSKHLQNRCGIMTGPVLDDQFFYGNACWVFISNLFFSPDMNDTLFEKIGKEVPVGTVILCSKPCENSQNFRILLKEIIQVPMNWIDGSNIHVYVKE